MKQVYLMHDSSVNDICYVVGYGFINSLEQKQEENPPDKEFTDNPLLNYRFVESELQSVKRSQIPQSYQNFIMCTDLSQRSRIAKQYRNLSNVWLIAKVQSLHGLVHPISKFRNVSVNSWDLGPTTNSPSHDSNLHIPTWVFRVWTHKGTSTVTL